MPQHRGTNARDDWQTPDKVLDLVRMVGSIWLDPCTAKDNPTDAIHYRTLEQNGLETDWLRSVNKGYQLAFVNPPYTKEWYVKIEAEMMRDTSMIALLMAKPGAMWFQRIAVLSDAVCFWQGRLTFKGAPDPAPFDSALLYKGPHPSLFRNVFGPYGWVV